MALNSIVISDSTTLISLINIERFDLIFRFARQIVITPAVYQEVSVQKRAKAILDEYIQQSDIMIDSIKKPDEVKVLRIRLDLGESESIALARERSLPLIIDEKRGKSIAQSLGVKTIGLIGILLIYKRKGYLSDKEIAEIANELESVHFRISKNLLALLLES
jgi:predicted nucleic acid-binding protein